MIAACAFAAANTIATDDRVFYVAPEEKQCENIKISPCHSLQQYAKNSSYYFQYTADVTLLFLPGTHGLSHDVITVKNVSNITLATYMWETIWDQEENESISIPTVNCSGTHAGFIFRHITGLSITGLMFTQCGFTYQNTTVPYKNTTKLEEWGGTLVLDEVTDFRMQNVGIEESLGYGILGYDVLGNSSIVNSSLDRNKGSANNSTTIHGGNMIINECNCTKRSPSYFYINSTNITGGQSFAYNASGFNLVLHCKSGSIKFFVSNVILANNRGAPQYGGGNFALQMSISSESNSSVSFLKCRVENGSAYLGGGFFISIFQYPPYKNVPSEREIIAVVNTTFVNNTAEAVGAGMYMRLHYYTRLYSSSAAIMLKNCTFSRNQVNSMNEERGGAAVTIVTFNVPSNRLHSTPQYAAAFIRCTFQENSFLKSPHTKSYVYGAVYIEEHSNVTFENCTIRDNRCTGIAAVHSYMTFIGRNVIAENQGENGGGVMLGDNSIMYFQQYAEVSICHNHADGTGGGIYVQYESLHAIRPCFFQLDSYILLNQTMWESIKIQLQDNAADITGTALYGGGIDDCYFLTNNNPLSDRSLENVKSGLVFDGIFNYTNQAGGKAAISSNPVQVCLCDPEPTLDCNYDMPRKIVSPGEDFNISVVVVGQRNGVVRGVVLGVVRADTHTQEYVNISSNEITQSVGTNCTNLTYTLHSSKEQLNVSLTLIVMDSIFRHNSLVVPLQITACPTGFILNAGTHKCECVHSLKVSEISCNAHNHSISRPANSWIGYSLQNNSNISENDSKNIIFVKYCPRLYCNPQDSEIRAFPNRIDQDQQCVMNRAGTICGGCINGYSTVFGTPRCIDCEHYNAWRALGIICIVALAGIVLVLFLMIFNLTVAEGTINGLIFYANIVEANRDLFFPLRQDAEQDAFWYVMLRAFIAWLNLDIGIQTCFYNGMDTYTKTWLQFVFPLYIWFIAGLMIWLSRKYNCMARIMQNNGTKILATLILLSYAKLLRAIINGLYFHSLESGEQTTLVWYLDGNVPYLTGKHVILFIAAAIFSIFLIPFTIVLLFIKRLQKLSHLWFFKWVNKLKPFFDAYTGTYNDSITFWEGFLLLVRIFLLICTAVDIDTTHFLMQIVAICGMVLTATWLHRAGIHKKHSLDILDAWLILNLLLWSLMIVYTNAQQHYNAQRHLAVVFVGPVFLTFVGVLCYHGYKSLSQLCVWRWLKSKFIETTSTAFRQAWETSSHVTGQVDVQESREQESLLAYPPSIANYSELCEP